MVATLCWCFCFQTIFVLFKTTWKLLKEQFEHLASNGPNNHLLRWFFKRKGFWLFTYSAGLEGTFLLLCCNLMSDAVFTLLWFSTCLWLIANLSKVCFSSALFDLCLLFVSEWDALTCSTCSTNEMLKEWSHFANVYHGELVGFTSSDVVWSWFVKSRFTKILKR